MFKKEISMVDFFGYVYIDDKMFNKELLSLGYARVATYPPNVKYVEEFKALQEIARKNNIGFWNNNFKRRK